jgi:hypothetical protein
MAIMPSLDIMGGGGSPKASDGDAGLLMLRLTKSGSCCNVPLTECSSDPFTLAITYPGTHLPRHLGMTPYSVWTKIGLSFFEGALQVDAGQDLGSNGCFVSVLPYVWIRISPAHLSFLSCSLFSLALFPRQE